MTAPFSLHSDSARTVVVGAGLAGLTAATYLARAGQRVTVLDKAASVGGRAITDAPSGFALNRGVHALYTGGAASSVLGELDVRYAAGRPGRIFARDAGGMHPFPVSALNLMRTDLLSAADKAELFNVFLHLSFLKPEHFAQQTVNQWIDSVATRPKVRQVLQAVARVSLYSAALDLASADTNIARLQQSAMHPIHYVDGGWQSLVDGLRRVAESAGVEILASASVEALDVRDGEVTGARLHDGRTLPADTLLLALPAEDAVRLLPSGSGRDLPQALPVHAACLDVALKRLPVPERPIVFDLERPRFLTVQSEFARLAPNGGAVLHAVQQFDGRQPVDARQARADLEAFVDEVQPGWHAQVVEHHFLPHMLASSALPLAGNGGMAGRPAHHSRDVANLYFAGDWVGREGYLVDASLASARESARQILRSRSRKPVLQAA